MRQALRATAICFLTVTFLGRGLFLTGNVYPWNNGPSGNASTNNPADCTAIPYSTHDWIAEHALMLLPDNERQWIMPHKMLYLLGTEAPDNDNIPSECGAPHNGYDDRNQGHSVEWAADWSKMIKDRAAVRAQEEYDKAVAAFKQGNLGAAAFYLGASAHYIGDVSQYGHSVPFENHHSDYEAWVGNRTKAFNGGIFESYIQLDGLVRRRAYTAVERISKITAGGKGKILHANAMDQLYPTKGEEFIDSIGHSLSLGVNELADVLHTFFLNVVADPGSI